MSEEGADETCDQTGPNCGQEDKASDKGKESALQQHDAGCGSSTKTSASVTSAASHKEKSPLVKTSDTFSSEDNPSVHSKDTSTNEDKPAVKRKDTNSEEDKSLEKSNSLSSNEDNPPASNKETSNNENKPSVDSKDTSSNADNPPVDSKDISSNGDNPLASGNITFSNGENLQVSNKGTSSNRDNTPASSKGISSNEDKPSVNSMDVSSDKDHSVLNHTNTSSNEGNPLVNSKGSSINDEGPSVNSKDSSSKGDKPPGRKRRSDKSGYFGGSMFTWLQSAGNAAIGEISEGIAAIGAKMFEEPEEREEPKPHQDNVRCSPSGEAKASESPATAPSHNSDNPSVSTKDTSSDEDSPPVNRLDTSNYEKKPLGTGEGTSSNGEKLLLNMSSVSDENNNPKTKKDLLRYAAVGVAAGTAAVVAAPLVLGAAGFAGAGVAAGSIAAATVETGGLFAMAAGNAAIGGITGGIAALGAKMLEDQASDKGKESVLHQHDAASCPSTKTSALATSAASHNENSPLVKTSDTSSGKDNPSVNSKDTSTNEDKPAVKRKDTSSDEDKPLASNKDTSNIEHKPSVNSKHTSCNSADNPPVNNKDISGNGDNPLASSNSAFSNGENLQVSNEDASSNRDNPPASSKYTSTNEDKPPVNSKDSSSDRDKPPESSNITSSTEDKPLVKSMDASSDKDHSVVNHADTSNRKESSSNDEGPTVNSKDSSSKGDKPPRRKRRSEKSGYFGSTMFAWLQSAGNAALGEISEGIAAIGAQLLEEPEEPEEPKPHQDNVECSSSAEANASESPTTASSHIGENPSVNSKDTSSDKDSPPVSHLHTSNHVDKPSGNVEGTSSNGEKPSVNVMKISSVSDEKSNLETQKDLMRYAAVGVAAGTAAVVAAPLVLGAAGLAGAGVAAGSIAAATVETGGLFAMAASNAAIGGITGGIAALGAKMLDKFVDIKLLICGSGSEAHAFAGIASSVKGTDVRVFSLNQDEVDYWFTAMHKNNLKVTFLRKGEEPTCNTSRPPMTTSNPVDAMQNIDIVVFVLPAFAHQILLNTLKPYFKPGTIIVGLPGAPGFEFQVQHVLGDVGQQCTIINFESSPWVCRISDSSVGCEVLGTKETLLGAIKRGKGVAPKKDPVSTLQYLLGPLPKLNISGHLLGVQLMSVNAYLHTSILYAQWEGWQGKPVDEPPLFYNGLTEPAADLLSSISDEIVNIARVIELKTEADLSHVVHIHLWLVRRYSRDISNRSTLYKAIQTNAAYQGIKHPVQTTEDGKFVPDFTHRYMTEDLPYGLVVIRGIAEIVGVQTPNIDKVLTWCQEKMGKEYLVNSKLQGKDLASSSAPQRYGFTTLESIL